MINPIEYQLIGIDTKGYTSGQHKFICPKCSPTRKKKSDPSLSVNLDTGEYKCWNPGCIWEEGGSVASKQFVRPKPIAPVDRKEHSSVYQYFEKRGINADTVDYFKISKTTKFFPQTGSEESCIAFNYYMNGNLINQKFKTRNKDFAMVKDAEKIPYNLDAIKESDKVLICEGEEEVMVWHQAGIKFAVSCPNGASLRNNNLEWLTRTYDYFKDKTIYLATDNDVPGKKLRDDLSRRFEPENLYVVNFPEGCKDANDFLLDYGEDSLFRLFSEAQPIPVPEVAEVDEIRDSLLEIYEHGYPKGDTLDYPRMDERIKYRRGLLTVTTGVPGHGKSTWIKQKSVRLACRRGWKFGVLSPEETHTLHAVRTMEIISGLRVGKSTMNPEIFNKLISIIGRHFFYYNTNTITDYHIDSLLKTAKLMIMRYGIDCLIMDPFNYIEIGGTDEQRNEAIGQFLVKLKKFCKYHDVAIWLVAHPRKMTQRADGTYDIPRMYDISGSHHWFNVPDNGEVVYIDRNTGDTEVIPLKVKYWFDGSVSNRQEDQCIFHHDKVTGRYAEFGNDFTNELSFANQSKLQGLEL